MQQHLYQWKPYVTNFGLQWYPRHANVAVDIDGVTKLLQSINPSKATRPDLIPVRVLKEAASVIAPYLCFIFQQSIDTGLVLDDWKHANIIAVYKKGLRTEAHNYRPVSLTSVPCKLLQHIMLRHIMTHPDAHNVLVDHQHGFRSNFMWDATH